MNIKQHIEAGHYERDEKGRALVPIAGGGTFVVCATDAPHTCPIVGFNKDNGSNFAYWPDTPNLLPPPPRKVEVKAYALMPTARCPSKLMAPTLYDNEHAARSAVINTDWWRIIELVGSYEEPWS